MQASSEEDNSEESDEESDDSPSYDGRYARPRGAAAGSNGAGQSSFSVHVAVSGKEVFHVYFVLLCCERCAVSVLILVV
jgi:hypothetical protein